MLCCSLHRYPVFLWFYCCCYWPILSPMNPNREISSVSVSMLSKFKEQAWLPSQRRGKVLIEVGHIQLSKLWVQNLKRDKKNTILRRTLSLPGSNDPALERRATNISSSKSVHCQFFFNSPPKIGLDPAEKTIMK